MKIHKNVTDKGGAVRERGIAPRARQASGASLVYPGVGEREGGGVGDVGFVGSTRTQPPLQYRRQRWWTRRKKVVCRRC